MTQAKARTSVLGQELSQYEARCVFELRVAEGVDLPRDFSSRLTATNEPRVLVSVGGATKHTLVGGGAAQSPVAFELDETPHALRLNLVMDSR